MAEKIKDTNKCKNISYSWIVKMSILPKIIYIYLAIPSKITMALFTEIGGKNPQIYKESQRALRSQNNFETKNVQSWRIFLPDFKTHYKATE